MSFAALCNKSNQCSVCFITVSFVKTKRQRTFIELIVSLFLSTTLSLLPWNLLYLYVRHLLTYIRNHVLRIHRLVVTMKRMKHIEPSTQRQNNTRLQLLRSHVTRGTVGFESRREQRTLSFFHFFLYFNIFSLYITVYLGFIFHSILWVN